MTRPEEKRVELGEGGYVRILPNALNHGTLLEVGWQDEGMAAVWLQPEQLRAVISALEDELEERF